MLSGIAVVMTLGVYGVVGGIVKLDDLGLWMTKRASGVAQAVGNGILRAAPYMMKGLSVVGTAAMFLVGNPKVSMWTDKSKSGIMWTNGHDQDRWLDGRHWGSI